MIFQKVRKVGNSLVVTIPKEEVDRLHLDDGDMIALQVNKAVVRPVLSDELLAASDASLERNKEGYLYLKGR